MRRSRDWRSRDWRGKKISRDWGEDWGDLMGLRVCTESHHPNFTFVNCANVDCYTFGIKRCQFLCESSHCPYFCQFSRNKGKKNNFFWRIFRPYLFCDQFYFHELIIELLILLWCYYDLLHIFFLLKKNNLTLVSYDIY